MENRIRPKNYCKSCNIYKAIHGKGLCRRCFDKGRYGDELREQARIRQHKLRWENIATYRIRENLKSKRRRLLPIERTKEKARQKSHSISLKDMCCRACGSTKRLARHHPDYLRPLNVEVLCITCHSIKHRKAFVLVHKKDKGVVSFDSFGNWKCAKCGTVSKDKKLLDIQKETDTFQIS